MTISFLGAKGIIASVFEVDIDDISDDISLGNSRYWDSLGHMRLILHLEKILGRTLEVEEITEIINLQGVYDLLNRK